MRAIGAALAVVLLLMTGCSPADVAAPALLTVDVTQGRTDRDARIVVMDVTNRSENPVELISAELDTPQFAEAAEWTRGTTLAPGRTVSLRASLPEPVCPVPADAAPTVSVTFDAAGVTSTITLTPTQSTGVLAIIARDDCIGVLAAEHAEIRVADTVSWIPGAHEPASLDLLVSPTDADGSVLIIDARSTILLSLVDAAGVPVEALPLGLTASADSPDQRITLLLVPARCDPHAIAEDKRGTIMILDVETNEGAGSPGASGAAYYRSSDDVKASLYAFVTDYCS